MPTILVVDDDENNVFLIRCFLEKEKFQVAEANSGLEALKIIDSGSLPDLVILDVMMPEMDGYEVCKKLKENEKTKHIPVIMLTARHATKDIVKGLNIGASDYITKPVNFQELIARIDTHIRLKNLEKDLIRKKKLESVLHMSVSMRHEINNPLTGILGIAELLVLDEEIPKSKRIKMATIIVDQSLRIRDIVKKISKIINPVEKGESGIDRMIDIHNSTEK